ncbi:MAG: hypothetical protein FVQ82_11240 [Planctomycetes bacterium]|nr:hypothetical protein [Planctomycetota bacterium]
MNLDRISLIIFLTVIIAAGTVCAADASVTAADAAAKTKADAEAADKLRFVKTTLLNGPTVQDRLDAAVALLYGKDKAARQILLETLAIKDNSPARQAICNTIINSRQAIPDKADFRKPLLVILAESNGLDAKLAAQATLIFEFSEIEDDLTKMAAASENVRDVRLNALYALQQRPVEKQAIATIASLISDPDKQVAQAARQALPYWIPAGMSRPEILRYLKRLSRSEISRKWIDFQEKEVRRLENERKKWEELYISSLSREYDNADDTAKGKILLGRLGSDLSPVRIWALEKVGTLSPSVAKVLPPQFNTQLLGLISDSDRDVRLITARMFSQMGDRNPAEKLLAQFKVEDYDDIKLELFKTLGEACYYAFLGDVIKLSEDIRSATLIIAEQYLGENDPDKAAVAAEVIRKMLEPNGLEPILVTKYLKLVSARFARAQSEAPELAGEILSVMASLCGQTAHRDITSRLYGTYFLNGLKNKDNEAVRRTSVTGLINIDKTTAFEKFKANSMIDDPSENIRTAMMKLAGETGKSEDITWLIGRLKANGESAIAWEAIKDILQRQKSAEIFKWTTKLAASGLSQERKMVLLIMADKKAELEKNTKVINAVRTKLRPMQLDVHLKAAAFDKASQIIADRLKEGDMSGENPLAKVIETFMSSATLELKTAFVKTLTAVSSKEVYMTGRPSWQQLMAKWKQMLKPTPTSVTVPKPR